MLRVGHSRRMTRSGASWVEALLALALALSLRCASGTYASSVVLPRVDSGLKNFLSTPFETIDRALANCRLGFLDVSATGAGTDALRQWIYAQMIAMDVRTGQKGGIDMVYAVSYSPSLGRA